MSRALNKFRQYASAGAAAETASSKPKVGATQTQMQKVASMLIHIIDRNNTDLPDRHRGLPEKLTKEIRDSFHIIDTDGDGLATREQIERLVYKIDPEMSGEEMLDLLDTADLDGDEMYDIDEYLFLMYLKWNDQESVDDIKEAFKVFDKDNSGTLSREEFAFILRKLGEPLTDLEVDEILNHFDRDGSGEIDFDEFAYVMTGPHLDDEGKDATGIPLTKGQSLPSLERLGLVRRILATPVSRAGSITNLSELKELELSAESPVMMRQTKQKKTDVVLEKVNERLEKTTSIGKTSAQVATKSARSGNISMASSVINQFKRA